MNKSIARPSATVIVLICVLTFAALIAVSTIFVLHRNNVQGEQATQVTTRENARIFKIVNQSNPYSKLIVYKPRIQNNALVIDYALTNERKDAPPTMGEKTSATGAGIGPAKAYLQDDATGTKYSVLKGSTVNACDGYATTKMPLQCSITFTKPPVETTLTLHWGGSQPNLGGFRAPAK